MLPNDNIPSQIVPMILYKIRDSLVVALIDNVPDDNPTKAQLVKVGRMQENPLSKNVAVAISHGDFEDPTYKDARIDHSELDQFRVRNLPVGEIGGGIYWWRRGTINVNVFFVRQRFEEEIAVQYAYDFYGRLQRAVEAVSLAGLVDDYGERCAGHPYVEASTFFESGGAKQFVFRGKLYWRALTWRT
jgi:hypothetical protein